MKYTFHTTKLSIIKKRYKYVIVNFLVMEVFNILFLACVSAIVGMVLMLVLQYYILAKYVQRSPVIGTAPKKPLFEKYSLPESLKKQLSTNDDSEQSKQSSIAVSLMLQFLFHELHHSDSIKRWFHKKLSLEFDELLSKTTTGKFFEAVKIRDLYLGSHFPDVKSISVENVKIDENHGHIDTLCLCLDVEYSGNFQLSVDAKMKFAKTAFLSIKVERIKGLARLHFTRIPYTHWSFSFYNEPQIELAVESQFQGRQLQSNISSLIINQIRKAFKRKHTLPNYKIRYKPFFTKNDPGQIDSDEIDISGQLEVNCIEMTRLCTDDTIESVYCTFTVDTFSWLSLQKQQSATDETFEYSIMLDLIIVKQKQENLGVVFKHEPFQQRNSDPKVTTVLNEVSVETVVPNSPAYLAGLKRADRIVAIENKAIYNVTQVAKLFKSLNLTSFNVRIERKVINYRTVCLKDDFEHLGERSKSNSTENILYPKSDNSEQSIKSERIPVGEIAVENAVEEDDFDTKNVLRTSGDTKNVTKSDYKIPKILSSSNENVSKIAYTIGNFSLRKRKQSGDRNTDRNSSDSSTKSTPNVSSSSSPQHDINKKWLRKPGDCQPTVKRVLDSKRSFESKFSDPSKQQSSPQTPTEAPNIELETKLKQESKIEIRSSPYTNNRICYESPNYPIDSTVRCNEEYLFNLKKELKYLNINVWGKKKDTSKSENEVLLGYVNVPVAEVIKACRSSMLGHYTKCYSFLPPDINITAISQTNPLFTHSGFEPCFCFGDILLSFVWSLDSDDDQVSSEEYEVLESKDMSSNVHSQHDFIRTHFHRATQCDFCSKKIWLKDAVQCRECAMCCHKKCVTKCQISTMCTRTSLEESEMKTTFLQQEENISQPTITMTEAIDDQNDIEELSEETKPQGLTAHRQSFSGLIASVASNSMKRVNSAHNLVIPDLHSCGSLISRSLPPSPQHTPGRKQSIIGLNPFDECPDILEACIDGTQDEFNNCISNVVEHLMQSIQDENIMDIAKESSKQLYTSMIQEDRVEKINKMISKLKTALDAQTQEHYELTRKMNNEELPTEKAKLAFLVGQADAKVHALSILMLHYCSGLQYAQEYSTATK